MNRRHGTVDSAAGLIPFGHLGWGYHDRSEFLVRAAEYIADGLAQNQWVEYVGSGKREQLRAELSLLPMGTGDVKITDTMEFYAVPSGDVVDPHVAVAARVAAVENAIAQGYTGFRAVVDATSVAQRTDQRDTFAQFEFLIDQQMAVLPVSALCAYDLTQIDAAGLICLHPLVGGAGPAFRIFAESGAGFALAGEIDSVDAEAFRSALQRIWPLLSDDEILVDARDVKFIGHRHLLELEWSAHADDRTVVLQDAPRVVTRLVDLLQLNHVLVKTATSAS